MADTAEEKRNTIKIIIINEAKDDFQKLINQNQLKKSLKVLQNISRVLRDTKTKAWGERNNYKIIPSFLWAESYSAEVIKHHREINKSTSEILGTKTNSLDVVVSKTEDSSLSVRYYFGEEENQSLNSCFK